jgi:C-terminal processing protease CtpA/Prc
LVQGGLGAGGYVSGYFLNKSSTAVLSIPSFSMQGPLAQSAQEAITNFVQMSKQAGVKKLVIDLQGNGGGTVLLGIDLFKQVCAAS